MDVADDLRACLEDWDDRAIIGGQEVSGYFASRPVDEGDGDQSVFGLVQVFGCSREDAVGLVEGDFIEVVGRGRFRYVRTFGPYETGLVEIEIGTIL